jgi:hypothetical protein
MWIEREPAPDVEGIHHDSVPRAQNHLLWDDHICNWSRIYKSHFSNSTEKNTNNANQSTTHPTKHFRVF